MTTTTAVEAGPAEATGWLDDLLVAAEGAVDDASAAIVVATRFGHDLPLPVGADARVRWDVLAALAARDLTVARVYEAHTDALAILAEAGSTTPAEGSWGVFAAEAPAVRLDATQTSEGWRLDGTKPWCSLGGQLDHALVTAHTTAGRRLFAVDLQNARVRAEQPEGWVARGLRTVTTVPVHFSDAPATPVGEAGWYLHRPGFAWGGIGVAACWLGGAEAVARSVRDAAARRTSPDGAPDPLRALQFGEIDVALYAARAVLASAAAQLAEPPVADPELLALRVRSVIADAVERTMHHADHALGPAPLGFDEVHARRIADLHLYVRQHHGEADYAALGARLISSSAR